MNKKKVKENAMKRIPEQILKNDQAMAAIQAMIGFRVDRMIHMNCTEKQINDALDAMYERLIDTLNSKESETTDKEGNTSNEHL